jgi:hypothetical protein
MGISASQSILEGILVAAKVLSTWPAAGLMDVELS